MNGQNRIVFQNHSGEDGDYALFMSLPHVTCEDGGPMLTNAWVARYVPDGAEEEIDVDNDIYAWYDTQRGSFGPGMITVGGTYHRAILGNKRRPGTTFHTVFRRGQTMLAPSKTHRAADGRFEIHAQQGPPKQELIGIAKRGDKGHIVPVITMQASPSFSYGVKPVAKYYLARVDGVEVGEAIDLRSVRYKAAVDFTADSAKNMSEAVVTHNEDGKFQVEYRNPPPPPTAAVDSLDAPSFGTLRRKKDRWSGNVTWPDTTTTATVVQASGMLIDSLSAKYNWSINTSQTKNGGVSMKVHFWLRDDSRQPDFLYQDDWKAAVEASLQPDGHQDLGCFPYSAYSSFTRLALAMH